MPNTFDIFISYKRKSLPTANNLYYRLTTRGYSTFFDLEEMGRDNYNVQLLNYIENAKDVFVILEEGSLDACQREDWEKDWFCHEVAFALEKKKNIIPLLIGGYKMPPVDFFPEKLKDLSLKNAPEFNYSYFDAYIDRLIQKDYLLSKPNLLDKNTSVFKFYSNEDCRVFKEGKLVCSLEGNSEEPYYLPVTRKGDYRFKAVNAVTGESKTIKERIDADEEKDVEIEWEEHKQIKPYQEWPRLSSTGEETKTIQVLGTSFNMKKIAVGSFYMGTVIPESNNTQIIATDVPNSHSVIISEGFYIGETPVTQELWSIIMHKNPSRFQNDCSPVESVTWEECQEFIKQLNQLTDLSFRLPTEAEWEFAARGGIKSRNLLYSGSNNIEEVAWYLNNSYNQTHPVKQKRPNELGLYDMSGNVWEWCQDYYAEYESGVQRNPIGPSKGSKHVFRGGCWCEVEDCRVTARRGGPANFKNAGGIGLRLALKDV